MDGAGLKVAINGTGIAGPTLAWWLQHYGHRPVLFEKAPAFRTGGYIIDFWGVGYDVADRMGILPRLREQAYRINGLRLVNRHGRANAKLDLKTFKSLADGRAISLLRSDLARAIYEAGEDIPCRFGLSVEDFTEDESGVGVQLSDGTTERFDLLVGADGMHSAVRRAAFGPEEDFIKPLGYRVAAFSVTGYQPREEGVYLGHTQPGRQVMRISLRGDRTVFLLIHRDDVLPGPDPGPNGHGVKDRLREVFGGMGWEVPAILDRLDDARDVYADSVSQIRLPHWTKGRVALVGDAAACPSLLAGEGAGLAMAEAYVLAGEIHQAGGDFAAAFHRYEDRFQGYLRDKQRSAEKMCGFFAPQTRFYTFLRDTAVNLSAFAWLARRFSRRTMKKIQLPDYGPPATLAGEKGRAAGI